MITVELKEWVEEIIATVERQEEERDDMNRDECHC